MIMNDPSPAGQAQSTPTAENINTKYVLPGRLFVTADPCVISTILGSCVAVCLWDTAQHIGGLNHFLLPHWAGVRQSSTRFGNLAMDRLIEDTLALGAQPRDLQAKIFGGARVLGSPQDPGIGDDLGARNVEVARRILAEEKIPIVAEDVGGRRGRKVMFQTFDGSVLVRRF